MDCPCQSGLGYWAYADVRALDDEEERECRAHALRISRASRGWRVKGDRVDSVDEKTLEQHRAADLMGARGEKAWSVFWEVEWPKRVNDFENPDFDPDIEIRTTRVDPPELILRPRDMKEKARRRFVLIQELVDGHHRIWGWVTPNEVRHYQPKGKYGKKPARFIPAAELHRLPFYSRFPRKHRRSE